MTTIKAKSGATIVPRHTVTYNADTFHEHEHDNFIEVTAEELLERIEPKVFKFLPDEKFISVDTETYYTGVDSNRMPSHVVRRWIQSRSKYHPNDFPFCISISDGKNSYAVYDTLENKFAEFKKLEPLLTDTSVSKIYQNAGYDMHMLANAGVNMKGRIHDTMFISKLTRANAYTHNLFDIIKELGEEHEVPAVLEFEQMVNMYKDQYRITDYRQIPRDLMTQYTCADTWNTIYAFEALYPTLEEYGVSELYEVESEMLVVAYNIERVGIRLDLELEDVLIPELIKEVDDAEREIYEIAGTTFNINSGKQLEQVLIDMGYGRLIEYRKPTELMLAKGQVQGNPRFDAIAMAKLDEAGVPLIQLIQKYKASLKLLNTFAIKLYEMRDHEGYVHCNFNTIEAKTGRFSISAPSMQNMPRRKDSRVRAAFIAPDDFRLFDFDFKAQESIILAHYSRAEFLTHMIHEGEDVHKATASLLYDVSVSEVTRSQREAAKAVGFAITYGAGPTKVAGMTGMTENEARYIMRLYMKRLPEVDMFIKTANKVAKEHRYVKTVMGRRVYVERGREYACVNYAIQGSAADSTKAKMVLIYKYLKANNFKTHILLQVHDSLLNAVHDDERDFILGYLRWLQTDYDTFRVPVSVDVAECYPTWREKVDIDVDAVKPPQEQLDKAEAYNLWEEGLL